MGGVGEFWGEMGILGMWLGEKRRERSLFIK